TSSCAATPRPTRTSLSADRKANASKFAAAMSTSSSSPVPGSEAPVADTLTNSQEARRQRVILTALELAAEGGYDAVQMRDVAARANVALGTIYRYFSSKDA